ncbi:hypothetical protein HHK36_024659 [Tetracentron sinense]|uniref:Alpha-1,3-glucosyltransferase n=1 Tax=Tetracentron sinense TaxID=13715 RepID=A0A835D6X2_TETSI|nr:hypothetical protein HHK36_024659 [Tetracentron sinense]
MRWTVLSSNAMVFFPAAPYFAFVYYAGHRNNRIAWNGIWFFFQMSAYFAPAFFSHLLGKCLRRQNPLLEVSKLGLVVMGTFALIWWPYLHSVDAFMGWLMYYGLLSMYPLICRDHLILPYAVLLAVLILMYYSPGGRGARERGSQDAWKTLLVSSLLLCSLVLQIIYLTLWPPDKYPFLIAIRGHDYAA